jgi:hypothetical protein
VHSGLACGAGRDLPSAFAAMRQGRAEKRPAGPRAGATGLQEPSPRSCVPCRPRHNGNQATASASRRGRGGAAGYRLAAGYSRAPSIPTSAGRPCWNKGVRPWGWPRPVRLQCRGLLHGPARVGCIAENATLLLRPLAPHAGGLEDRAEATAPKGGLSNAP